MGFSGFPWERYGQQKTRKASKLAGLRDWCGTLENALGVLNHNIRKLAAVIAMSNG